MNYKSFNRLREDNPFTPLNDLVQEVVLAKILCFDIKPNTNINVNQLAKELGVSRSPVNQALDNLVVQGYMQKKKNKGYMVEEISQRTYQDAMEIAYLIEPYAAGKAVRNGTKAQFSRLREIAQELKKVYNDAIVSYESINLVKMIGLESDFHTLIVEMSGNDMLIQYYREVRDKLMRFRVYLLHNPTDEIYKELAKDHLIICDTFLLNSSEISEAVMRRHLEITMRRSADNNPI